jgi:hypothetical protein
VDTIKGHLQPITVAWTDIEYTSSNDWIGVWASTEHYTLFQAPLKFKFVCEVCRNHSLVPPVFPPVNGSVDFIMQNYREDLVFIYVHGSSQYPESIARSQVITVANPQLPQGGHLSFVEGADGRIDHSRMRIQWSSAPVDAPVVKWGASSGKYTLSSHYSNPANVSTVPYTKDDMCDTEVQPAGLHGFFPPPSNHTAVMYKLKPDTRYYYVYGSEAGGFSPERSFVSAPLPSPTHRTVIAAFGDMGNTEQDGSYHHSWDFGDKGEIPSQNTTNRIADDKDAEFVLHIGDISYACGFLSEWDNFFAMVEPVATSKPWMVGIGNHEQGFSKSWIPGTDSGGECGVPYNANFPWASQNPEAPFQEREPWYEIVYGSVHTIVMSTEHDFTPGSPQYAWIERALANVDRTVTPWLMVAGHRPMYVDSDYVGPATAKLKEYMEDLFVKYKVDVCIWGHNHSYQRSCLVQNNGTCVKGLDRAGVHLNATPVSVRMDSENPMVGKDEQTSSVNAQGKDGCAPHGILQLVIGMAGYDLNGLSDVPPAWAEVTNNSTWGYLNMDFMSPTELKTQFISDQDGSVVDEYVLKKDPCDAQ